MHIFCVIKESTENNQKHLFQNEILVLKAYFPEIKYWIGYNIGSKQDNLKLSFA